VPLRRLGGPIEFRSADRCYRYGLKARDAGAMYNLGILLAEDDPAAAREWYLKAAEAD
jgi:TPR repeat protein